jgi:hypothetical protein
VRSTVLFLAIALIFGVLIVLFSQTASVGAVGAPTDNSTIPNFPIGDQAQDEIKPLVNYVRLGPTSQTKSTPPNIIPNFIGVSEQDKFKITATENWYLQVDINASGWLYIYEYFSAGEKFSGKWIAYKWQLPQSGLWKVGPFTAGTDELEGQHVYRFWFYSDGLWAGEDPKASQNILIYWTYSKGQPAEQPAGQIPPQPPSTSAKEATFLNQLNSVVTKPVALVLGPLVLLAIVIVGLYMYRRYAGRKRIQDTALLPVEEEPENAFAALPLAAASAKIALPNGVELRLVGSRVIGRGDLARALDLDELGLISRRHFAVKSEGEQFYIEDLDSANGTRLNGVDISGKGPVSLSTDDVIEPAGAIPLTFYVL